MRRTRLGPAEIVHVGDHLENDVAGAKRLGWYTIWVNRASAPAPDGGGRGGRGDLLPERAAASGGRHRGRPRAPPPDDRPATPTSVPGATPQNDVRRDAVTFRDDCLPGRALLRGRLGLVPGLPLRVGHSVHDLARLVVVQGEALLLGRRPIPLGQAVAAKAREVHEIDVLVRPGCSRRCATKVRNAAASSAVRVSSSIRFTPGSASQSAF